MAGVETGDIVLGVRAHVCGVLTPGVTADVDKHVLTHR